MRIPLVVALLCGAAPGFSEDAACPEVNRAFNLPPPAEAMCPDRGSAVKGAWGNAGCLSSFWLYLSDDQKAAAGKWSASDPASREKTLSKGLDRCNSDLTAMARMEVSYQKLKALCPKSGFAEFDLSMRDKFMPAHKEVDAGVLKRLDRLMPGGSALDATGVWTVRGMTAKQWWVAKNVARAQAAEKAGKLEQTSAGFQDKADAAEAADSEEDAKAEADGMFGEGEDPNGPQLMDAAAPGGGALAAGAQGAHSPESRYGRARKAPPTQEVPPSLQKLADEKLAKDAQLDAAKERLKAAGLDPESSPDRKVLDKKLGKADAAQVELALEYRDERQHAASGWDYFMDPKREREYGPAFGIEPGDSPGDRFDKKLAGMDGIERDLKQRLAKTEDEGKRRSLERSLDDLDRSKSFVQGQWDSEIGSNQSQLEEARSKIESARESGAELDEELAALKAERNSGKARTRDELDDLGDRYHDLNRRKAKSLDELRQAEGEKMLIEGKLAGLNAKVEPELRSFLPWEKKAEQERAPQPADLGESGYSSSELGSSETSYQPEPEEPESSEPSYEPEPAQDESETQYAEEPAQPAQSSPAVPPSPAFLAQPKGPPIAAPNPFDPSRGRLMISNLPEGASVSIFTLAGEKVAETSSGGSGTISWDGRTSGGSEVASGIYIVYVMGEGRRTTLKIAVKR